ncbi:MAG TPA: hypothetical protein ENK50_03395 [Sedimenticola sp.]|nr:hypothetical protein [Sedimenticola sp.]
MAEEILGHCWNCGAGLGPLDYGRETNCPGCGRPTRVCRNCRWYAPGRPDACEEPVAEPVLDKVRANFCSFFEPTDPGGGGVEGDLLQAAEALFKP